jgi:antitoxin PrlF
MPASTMTSRGQITIPVQVRVALGLKAGDHVEFVELETGEFAIVAANAPVRRLKGLISKPTKPVSIQEMNQSLVTRRLNE